VGENIDRLTFGRSRLERRREETRGDDVGLTRQCVARAVSASFSASPRRLCLRCRVVARDGMPTTTRRRTRRGRDDEESDDDAPEEVTGSSARAAATARRGAEREATRARREETKAAAAAAVKKRREAERAAEAKKKKTNEENAKKAAADEDEDEDDDLEELPDDVVDALGRRERGEPSETGESESDEDAAAFEAHLNGGKKRKKLKGKKVKRRAYERDGFEVVALDVDGEDDGPGASVPTSAMDFMRSRLLEKHARSDEMLRNAKTGRIPNAFARR
jgi:hypothetical protein